MLGIVRHGKPLDVRVTPAAEVILDPRTGVKATLGRIGMMPSAPFVPISVSEAFSTAGSLTIENGGKVFTALGVEGWARHPWTCSALGTRLGREWTMFARTATSSWFNRAAWIGCFRYPVGSRHAKNRIGPSGDGGGFRRARLLAIF